MRVRIVLTLAALAVAALPAATGSAAEMCLGREATKVGTAGPDHIFGTAAADVIVGLGGDDTINGMGGNDRICGGGGDDIIRPGSGNDRVRGGAGRDIILGSSGVDILRGGPGDDNIHGDDGGDRLFGQGGNDTLDGDTGVDTVTGGPGTDTCYGETRVTCELPGRVFFGNGTWAVPTELPAGRYRMIADGTSCFWERLSGLGGTEGEVITRYFGWETQIVDIKPTDKGFHSSLCNLWINDLTPRRANPSADWVSDGHLLVGSEIAPGTWRNSGMGDSCYWERLAGFRGGGIDTISSALTSGASTVRIAPTDVGFFAQASCGTWTKIG